MDLDARGSAGHAEPRPVRIVRIITRLNIGGPSIHVSLLSRRLRPPAYETVLITGQPDESEGDMSYLLSEAAVRRVTLSSLKRPVNLWADARAWWRIFRIIQRERPTVVHTHMAKAGALGRTAAMVHNALARLRSWMRGEPFQGCRIIHTFHGHVLEGYFSPQRTKLFIMIERWLARGSDHLVAVSRTVRDDLLALGIGTSQQWRVIPLGVDLSSFETLPLPNGVLPLRVGLVGRLVSIKHPTLFLDAFAQFGRQQEGVQLTGLVVGDGPLRASLEREVRELGLEGVVRFLGWQEDLREVYAKLDITCLTSWNEGTPLALIEAMAAGRAVIATDVGGVRDVLGESHVTAPLAAGMCHIGKRGILVRPGDVQGLVAAFEAVACDVGLRQRLGVEARAFVTEHFTAERLVSDITALYDTLLKRRET